MSLNGLDKRQFQAPRGGERLGRPSSGAAGNADDPKSDSNLVAAALCCKTAGEIEKSKWKFQVKLNGWLLSTLARSSKLRGAPGRLKT